MFGGDNAEKQSYYSSGCSQNNQFSGRNSDGVEQNPNPNRLYRQNFDVQNGNFASNFKGYDNGGVSGMTHFAEENTFGGSYDGNKEMSQQNMHNAGMNIQNGAETRYSNRPHYHQTWNESRGDAITNNTQVPLSNVDSVEVAEGVHSRSKMEDLDEYIKEQKLKEAVELLELLQNEDVQVDLSRYTALIKACGENEALDEGKFVHKHLLNSTPHLEVRTYNCILEMFARCGSMDLASEVFDQMPKRNLTSWDIMISGFAKHGHGEDALDLFSEFKKSGLMPDGQMFIGTFSACGGLCDIIEGMLHFESMMKDYGIVPTMDHYVSIVDMMGNAGYLNEALDFVEKLTVEPAIEIWETLMKFSRIHGDVELGDRCADIINLVDPTRLDDQSNAGLIPNEEECGQNLLDVGYRVLRHGEQECIKVGYRVVRYGVKECRAGDRSHPDYERIYTLLAGLKQQMKEAGYVPETKFVLHDVDQEVKEEALMVLSRRPAAAQGFLMSAPRKPVSIFTNFTICGDCHHAFKIISKIVGREIIRRDSKRFHHFRDGSCSCNDFW